MVAVPPGLSARAWTPCLVVLRHPEALTLSTVRRLPRFGELGWVYHRTMPKRSSKPRDLNRSPAEIAHEATEEQMTAEQHPPKNPAAVELGRKGGLRGGKARAAKLSAEQRSAIAKMAAEKRWGKK